MSDTKAALDTAEATLKEKQAATEKAEQDKIQAEDAVNAAADELTQKNKEAANAEKEAADAEKEYQDAQKKYEQDKKAAEDALNSARKEYEEAGIRFLSENMTTEKSYEQIVADTISDECLINENVFVEEGSIEYFKKNLKEMLSVKALLQAAEVSKTGNADRLKEGVDELRLDYNLMMFSAICNAVQTVTGCEHITDDRVNEILGIEYATGKKDWRKSLYGRPRKSISWLV